MAYDQSKLIKDVRIYLGGVSTDKLAEATIIHYSDFYDANAKYTSKYPYILWKTTLASLDFLKAATASSTDNAAKTSRKEKVGDVEVTVSSDSSSSSATAVSYQDLYDDYVENPWKFGIELTEGSSVVHINGVNAQEVNDYRTNTKTTSTYNPLSAAAFPKVTGVAAGRRGFRTRSYY